MCGSKLHLFNHLASCCQQQYKMFLILTYNPYVPRSCVTNYIIRTRRYK
jgi:hypothetical protein